MMNILIVAVIHFAPFFSTMENPVKKSLVSIVDGFDF